MIFCIKNTVLHFIHFGRFPRVSGEGCHGIHKRRRTICESDVSVTSWNAGKGVGEDYEEYCGIIAHTP